MSIALSNSIFQRVDLSHLKYFYAVATFGGFSKASRAAGISQPALSLGLKKLEKELGYHLIEREPGQFSLTEEGFKLLSFCQRLESSLEFFLSDLGKGPENSRRRYRIGTAYSVGYTPLSALCRLAGDLPEPIDIDIMERSSFQLLKDLHAGHIDAAVVADEAHDPRVHMTPLLKDQVTFIVGPRQRKLFYRKAWEKALSQILLVNYPRETPMRYLVDRICINQNLSFRASISMTGAEALKSLVCQDVGAGFILSSLVENELERGLVWTPEEIPFPMPKRKLMLAVRPGDEDGELATLIRRLFIKKKPRRAV